MADEVRTIRYCADILSTKLLPENNILYNEDEYSFDQLTDRIEPFRLARGNGRNPFQFRNYYLKKKTFLVYNQFIDSIPFLVRSGAPVVIWFGPQNSYLKATLIANLTTEDITLILFSVEDQLWQWLDLNSSLTVASLVLQVTIHTNTEQLVTRSHAYGSVRSILVRCISADLTRTQRSLRPYRKVDGIFDDDTRLMIKLVADLTLFSEELGDQQRNDKKNEMGAQRNYDRALKLCVLVQKF